MSAFSQKFSEIIETHNVKAKEICCKLHIKEAYFSKLKNGMIIPPSYEYLEKIFKEIGLSADENDELKKLYAELKFGDRYIYIKKILKKLYGDDKTDNTERVFFSDNFKKNSVISSKTQIINTIGYLFSNKQSHIRIKLQDAEIMEKISSIFTHENCRNDCIIYLENYSENTNDNYNLSVFSNLAGIFSKFNIYVHAEYCSVKEIFRHCSFPFIIIGDTDAVLIDKDCQNAVHTDEPKKIELLKQIFDNSFSSLPNFSICYNELLDFLYKSKEILTYSENNTDIVYVIKQCPCVLFGAKDPELLWRHIKPSPQRNKLAALYQEWIYDYSKTTNHEFMLFSFKGLEKFFKSDEYYETARHLTLPVSKKIRYMCGQTLIEYSGRKKFIEPLLVNNSFLDDFSDCMINIWNNGNMLFVIDCGDREGFFVVNDKCIANSIINFIKTASVDNFMLDSTATIEIIRDMLDKNIGLISK